MASGWTRHVFNVIFDHPMVHSKCKTSVLEKLEMMAIDGDQKFLVLLYKLKCGQICQTCP